ncbi:hypothetical protein Tco_0569151 [Tanacetum coccineum]
MNDETSDLEEANHDNEQEIGEIFRIETNLFDYETPLCEKFKEFNYLLKIDLDVLTSDIDRYEITNHDQEERKNVNEEEEKCEEFNDHERPVCNIRRFEMIKYSFGQGEDYVAIKEDEYEDLTRISEDACQAYKEIFRMMGDGWMPTRME